MNQEKSIDTPLTTEKQIKPIPPSNRPFPEAETDTIPFTRDTANRPILIFGMDRSGTSLVGDMVHRWGAFGGTAKALTRVGDKRNPEGFFEDPYLQAFLGELFDTIDTAFWDEGFEEKLAEAATESQWEDRFRKLIEKLQEPNKPWFWKEPLLGVLAPFWKPFLPDAQLIIPIRDPFACAASWARFRIPEDLQESCPAIPFNLLRWQRLMCKSMEVANAYSNTKIISYEALLREPAAVSEDLASHLNYLYGFAGSPKEQAVVMANAVRQDLSRSATETVFLERDDVLAVHKELYEFLLQKMEDPTLEFNPKRFPMPLGWRSFLQVLEAFLAFHYEAEALISSPWELVKLYFSEMTRELFGEREEAQPENTEIPENPENPERSEKVGKIAS